MNDVKLEVRKPSERLIGLVDAIPELKLEGDKVKYKYSVMYDATRGYIQWEINKDSIEYNPLKNAYKLKEACNRKITSVTEESFCDLLNEHLYLVAKEKMEELLPQIQEHFPEAVIKNAEENDAWYIWERADQYSIIVAWNGYDYKYVNGAYERIWEDKENLIVKTPKPKEWWETQKTHYIVDLNLNNNCFEIAKCLYGPPTNCNSVGITRFKNEEEAQLMCDKLNKVIKGE